VDGDVYPLTAAARRRDVPIMEMLLSRGAKINLGYEGENALMLAVGLGDIKMAKYLLSKGADPNASEGSDLTGTHLMFAAEKGNLEMIKLLVEHGAKVNSKMSDGSTVITRAQKQGNTAVVEYLKKAGAK